MVEAQEKPLMLSVARATGSQTIVQDSITNFFGLEQFFLFPNKFFVLLEQLKIYSKIKKLFCNKFDWITYVGLFVGLI